MPNSIQASRSFWRPACCLMLVALSIAACGIGMDAQARVERGQQAIDEGRYQAAIIDARNVLQDDPDNIAARILLGRALIEIADGVTAEKEIRRAIELGAPADETAVYLGEALLVQGKFRNVIAVITVDSVTSDESRRAVMRLRGHALVGLRQAVEARALYTEVLQADSEDIESQLGIVSSYVVEQNFVQARATMNQILTVHDSDVSAWLTSASLSMRTRDTERAASDYANAMRLLRERTDIPREMRALSGFAEAVMLQNKPDDARQALLRMQEIAPEDIRTLLVAARLSALAQDWMAAQFQLQEILRRAPDLRPAQMLLGVVHKESGNLGQAEMYLAAVVAASPQSTNARRLLAETRLLLDKSADARQAIDAIVAGPNADSRSLSIAAAASIDLGEFHDAAELLERSVAADPDNIELRIELALAYFRSGNAVKSQQLLLTIPDTADDRSDFRRAALLVMVLRTTGSEAETVAGAEALLERWPDRADAHVLVGSIDMSNNDYAAARERFTISSALAPDDVRPIRYLAQLDEMEDEPGAARDRYRKILELQPDDAPAMMALARLATLGENRDESREWLEKARLADAGAVELRAQLGAQYLSSGDFAAAAAVAREGLDLDPDNAQLHNIMGFARFGQNDYRGAASDFGKAVLLEPDEPVHALNLARAEDKQGDVDAARAALQRSPDVTLQHIPSGVMLAWLHVKAGDLDAATDIARQLRAQHPDESSPHALQAELSMRGGDLQSAAAAYDQALSIRNDSRYAIRAYQIRRRASLPAPLQPLTAYLQERPFDSAVRLFLAQAYQRERQTDNAHAEYARVLEYEPDNLIAGNNLAWGYFTVGDPRAEGIARQAHASHPDNASILDTLGWILVRKGAVDDGIEFLRDAVGSGNASHEARYHLAAALVEAGGQEEAQEILESILSSDAEFSSRQEAEKLLATF